LPVLWGLVYWLARRRREDSAWSGYIDAELLATLRLDEDRIIGIRPWPLLALVWSIAAIALAGPSWERDQAPAYRASAAWVFVLDLSPSMSLTDVAPDRVTRARYALDDLLNAAHDARVGLVVFSDEPYTVTPLTRDIATVKALLPPLKPDIMPSPGDNLAPALRQAAKLLQQGGAKDQQIVVLTDGFDDPAAALSAAASIRAKHISLSIVGIGTTGGAATRRGRRLHAGQTRPRSAGPAGQIAPAATGRNRRRPLCRYRAIARAAGQHGKHFRCA
jgi:Ca-activated chloride channel family protein